MALTKTGAAYLAASFLTSRNNAGVAADYITWMDAQLVPDTAMDALLGASRSSKNPARVLVQAALLYDQLDNVPTIATVTPATGGIAGGTATVLVGLNFTGATGVKFATSAGTAFSVVDDTHVHVTSPAHASGVVDVVLTGPGGTATKTGGFTYS